MITSVFWGEKYVCILAWVPKLVQCLVSRHVTFRSIEVESPHIK